MKPSYYVKLLELRSWREGGQANNVENARRSLALGVIIEICFAVILLKIHNRASLSPLPSAGRCWAVWVGYSGHILAVRQGCKEETEDSTQKGVPCTLWKKYFWILSASYFLQSIPASHIKQYCFFTKFCIIANLIVSGLWTGQWLNLNNYPVQINVLNHFMSKEYVLNCITLSQKVTYGMRTSALWLPPLPSSSLWESKEKKTIKDSVCGSTCLSSPLH